ncbi:ATP-binding protein [Nocardiopsis sp. SBT366]|uniref:ATP-binding protein n=1 Tax=Nocardiopsis sp. SBT366 TaxID=1580529 RepID=UPI00066DE396|nr:ATP-binding protein [Nocardiopsis sp. SBT366]
MTIVPHTPAPLHSVTATAPSAGLRWPFRVYPGDLSQVSRVRSELAADLGRLAGLAPQTVADVILCASELFANACDHSLSGEDPEGQVIRTLHMPTATTLKVVIIDDGTRSDTAGRADAADQLGPKLPHQRTPNEWDEAERGRGLLLIHHLASRWGTRSVLDFPFCAGLGTVAWAEFTLPGDQP